MAEVTRSDPALQDRTAEADDSAASRARLGRSAAWLVANGVITLLLGAGYWALAARRLDPEEVGRAATKLSQVLLAANLGVVGIKHSMARQLAAGSVPGHRLLLVGGAVTASVATVAALGLGVFVHATGLAATTRSAFADVVATVALAVLWAFFVLQDSLLTAVGRARMVTVVNSVHGVVKLALVMAPVTPASSLLLWSWFGPVIVIVPFAYAYLWRVTSRGPARVGNGTVEVRSVVTSMGAEHLASVIWLALTLGMPTLVLELAGPEESGVWYLAFSLAYGLYLVTSSIGGAGLVEVATSGTSGAAAIRRRALAYCFGLVVPGAAAAVLFAPMAVTILGPDYEPVVPVFRLVALASVAFVVISTEVNIARGLGRSRDVGRWHLAIVAAVVPLSVATVPALGAQGAALAWLVGLSLTAVWIGLRTRRRNEVSGTEVGRGFALRRPLGWRAASAGREELVRRAAAVLQARIELGRTWSQRHGVLVAEAVVGDRYGILRVASTPDAVEELARHEHGAEMARGRSWVGALAVPAVLRAEWQPDLAVVLEERLPGRAMTEMEDPQQLIAGVEAAERLMWQIDSDPVTEVVDREWLGRHLGPALAVLAEHVPASGVERLRARLSEGLAGHAFEAGVVHGDLSLGNVLVDDGVPTALVDWETAAEHGPRLVDGISLRLSAARRLTGNEYGRIIDDALSRPGSAPLPLVPEDSPLREDIGVLLAWTMHCAANLRKDPRYGRGSLWYGRNIRPVLRVLRARRRPLARVVASLRRTFGPPDRVAAPDLRRGSPERARPRFTRWRTANRSGRSTGLGTAVLAIGAAAWIVGALGADLEQLGGHGLGVEIGLLGLAGLVAMTAALVIAITGTSSPVVGWSAVVGFAVSVHATPAILYGTPRYPWTWKHIGVVDFIERTGGVDRTIEALPIYHNWPGFFGAATALSDLTGIDVVTLARWAPLAIGLCQLGAAIYVVRVLATDEATRMLAGFLFVVFNWVGQEYFSPQGLAFVLYLVFLGLILRLAAEPLPGMRPLQRWQRAGLWGLAAQVLVVTVASHQLTPLMMLLSLVGLLLTRQLRGVWPVVMVAMLTALWALSIALPYVGANIGDAFESFGSIASNSSTDIVEPLADVSAANRQVVLAGRALFLAGFFGAMVGFAVRWRRGHRDIATAALALAPFAAIALNDFDGEMLLRVVLFTSPFIGLLCARGALERYRADRKLWVRPLLVGVAIVVVLPLFLLAHYGKEAQYYFPPDEVALVGELFSRAPAGSLIVEGNRNYPNQFVRYEQFVTVPIDREPVATRRRILADPVVELERWLDGHDGPAAFVLLTDSMGASSDELGLLSRGAIHEMESTLRASERFTVVFESEHAVVLTLTLTEKEQ